MCWRGRSSAEVTEDGYEWICSYLDSCESNLLEFELDVDGQHFFDKMDLQLPSPLQPNERREVPLQLTPFEPSVMSELPSKPDVATPDAESASLISYCALLEETQSTATTSRRLAQAKSQAARHAVTTPRKRRTRGLNCYGETRTKPRSQFPIDNCMKPTTRSSSRKKFNRRLFY